MNTLINNLIQKYNVDLSELVVLTEGASGPYLLNPFIALAAGATNVICKVKDSRFADAKVVKEKFLEKAECGTVKTASLKDDLDYNDYGAADIITNSGHLRPISKENITHMKETAVIPLMWKHGNFMMGI